MSRIILHGGQTPLFACHSQHKRNQKLDTFKPCHNCIFWRWSFPEHSYKCACKDSFLNQRKGDSNA